MSEATFTILDDGRLERVDRRGASARIEAARAAGRPVAVDDGEGAAYLGVSAAERARQLTSLVAPDFTLPDLDGRPHSLADYRGRKVFLVAYGSW